MATRRKVKSPEDPRLKLIRAVMQAMADRSGDERWTQVDPEIVAPWIGGASSVEEAVQELEEQSVRIEHVDDRFA